MVNDASLKRRPLRRLRFALWLLPALVTLAAVLSLLGAGPGEAASTPRLAVEANLLMRPESVDSFERAAWAPAALPLTRFLVEYWREMGPWLALLLAGFGLMGLLVTRPSPPVVQARDR